jgi:hypothetical protein
LHQKNNERNTIDRLGFCYFAVLFSLFSGIGSLAAQIWGFDGFSFTLSTFDIVRLIVGLVGFSVCIFFSKWGEKENW